MKAAADLEVELANVSPTVTGKIPLWLEGTLIRNGPVNVAVDGKANKHWFDGLAMLHGFSFHGGEVQYSNKFLRTEAFNKVFQEGALDYAGFATDPCRSLFKRFFTWLLPHSTPELQNANINAAKYADQYVALTETPLPVKFNPKTLETLGILDFQDELPKERCWESAHPHYDLKNKAILNYLIEYGKKSFYTFYRIQKDMPSRQIVAKVPVDNPAYMHSFAITENYLILAEYPFVINPFDLLLKGRPFIENFSWQPERGTNFICINRKNGNVKSRLKTKAFFAFHHINAFERGDQVILDIVCYDDPKIITDIANYFKGSAKNEAPSRVERFYLPLAGKTASSEILSDLAIELPRINPALDGRPYAFGYFADAREPRKGDETRALYKLNTETKVVLQWSEKGCSPGEPIFVPKPNAQYEDDGIILALVLDLIKQGSFLLILDAKNFEEISRATVPHMIPPGLHGEFFF